MSDIFVFSADEDSNDYSTMGLVGALMPASCVFTEEMNGESGLELTHPLDDFGRYTAIRCQHRFIRRLQKSALSKKLKAQVLFAYFILLLR